ncbi:MAG: hypothetical protein HY821_03455, partial [Acidobacteria bacterium]|nr:hypothetical protein [Acidobacteriota bacterium]
MQRALSVILAASLVQAADLPVTRVIVYKNGVAYYERSGEVKPGESGRLDFKAAEMDDVLKSLVVDAPGGVARIRYELSEPLQKKLADQGIQIGAQQPLSVLLDQWRGARIELKYRGEAVSGSVISGRLTAASQQQPQKQELTILADNGELRILDLDAAAGIRLADPRLQQQLNDALLAMVQSRSRDKRAVFVDPVGSAAQRLIARYLAPAPVWKTSYRLVLPDAGEATLEGWAIVDNATGEDWSNVDLTVVSGKPVSFISRLYDARYIQRREASLPDEMALAPTLYDGAMRKDALQAARGNASAVGGVRQLRAANEANMMNAPAAAPPAPMMLSTVEPATEAREAGELFEYHFARPVNARKDESLLLPFVQQKVGARKLLIYSDRSQPNPRNAAELTNTTGKTLDGGPITVYHSAGYSGEALVETLKAGDKRLISYAVDQATRVTTNFESGSDTIRSLKANRGLVTTRTAVETTTTYTIDNADAKEKTLVIEHPVDKSQKLLRPKADETTPNAYRFAVKLTPRSSQKLAVVEEREVEESITISSLTPDVLLTYTQSKSLPAAARPQLENILAKK